MNRKTFKKTYASTDIPTVAAAVDGLLRLESQAQVEAFLDNIAEQHITAREQLPEAADKKSLTLWIRGYALTPEEEEAGALGNFATLAYKEIGMRWTIYPTKICLPPAKHPQRKYVARGKHPNWAHPVLKAIKKGKTYTTIEAAQEELATLHEQYPSASIPTLQKLYLMVFTRSSEADAKKSPVEKWVFEPKVNPEGSYYIDIYPNTSKARSSKVTPDKRTPEAPSATAAATPKGVFTARESLRRKKKGKR